MPIWLLLVQTYVAVNQNLRSGSLEVTAIILTKEEEEINHFKKHSKLLIYLKKKKFLGLDHAWELKCSLRFLFNQRFPIFEVPTRQSAPSSGWHIVLLLLQPPVSRRQGRCGWLHTDLPHARCGGDASRMKWIDKTTVLTECEFHFSRLHTRGISEKRHPQRTEEAQGFCVAILFQLWGCILKRSHEIRGSATNYNLHSVEITALK